MLEKINGQNETLSQIDMELGRIEKFRRTHIVKHHLSPDEVKQAESIHTLRKNFSLGVVAFGQDTDGAGIDELSPDGRSPHRSALRSPEKRTPTNKKNQRKDLYLSTTISTGQALQSDRLGSDNSPIKIIGSLASSDGLLMEDLNRYQIFAFKNKIRPPPLANVCSRAFMNPNEKASTKDLSSLA